MIATTINTEFAPEQPSGSEFLIDQVPYDASKNVDLALFDLNEDCIIDWPMVYILTNQEEAYIGQTTSVARRMNQHSANPKKKSFTHASVIYNKESNVSVITDYEHRLIQLMHADGRYRLTNKNEGMSDSRYFAKDIYSVMFEDLWKELQKMDLASHSIKELEESEAFKYSPFKSLTSDQKVALDQILLAITNGVDNANPIIVEGMPGTGKTILAIFLLKSLKDNPRYKNLNIKLLEPVTSLRETLKKSLKGLTNVNEKDIIGPNDIAKFKTGFVDEKRGNIDILLVDEAHRLKQRKNIVNYKNFDDTNKKLGLKSDSTQLDWILNQAKLPVFFYDQFQIIGPSSIGHEEISSKLSHALKHKIILGNQMRVKGGEIYLNYITDILAGNKPSLKNFDGYEFKLHYSFKEFSNCFEKRLQKHSLTRMLAGFAWGWKTKKDKSPEAFDITIEGFNKRWNCKQENWVGLGVDNPTIAREIGCIHSIQGYDLSYAFVIIGNDIKIDPETGTFFADRSEYYDRNGKATATAEELTQYIINIYYVLMTRGVYGTHLYICDPETRDYFSKYISCDSNILP